MSVVSIRDLGRNPSRVVDEVARSGRPSLVTKNGRPVVAIVRIDQVALEDWMLASTSDPAIGRHLERSPEDLLRAASARHRPVSMTIEDLSDEESARFWAVLERL